MGWLDRTKNQQAADPQRAHPQTGTSWLPFTTPTERIVTSAVLICIATCSLLFGVVGGMVALGVYALAFKLYERRQGDHTTPPPGAE